MKKRNKAIALFSSLMAIPLGFAVGSVAVNAATEEDFASGMYEYPSEFGPAVGEAIAGAGALDGYYLVNFRHGYVISATDNIEIIKTNPSSIYYATGNKHVTDAEGTEAFNAPAEMAEISRAFGLAYLGGYGNNLLSVYQEYLTELSLGTYSEAKAPMLYGKPYNLGIVMNAQEAARLNDMTGVYYRYGDSTAENGVPLGDNASYATTYVRTSFVSVTGSDSEGWDFILIKDDFLTAYGKCVSSGGRLGKATSYQKKIDVDGTEREVQLFQYGFLYRDGDGTVKYDTTRYYDESDKAFKEIPVQAYISVPDEFGGTVGGITEHGGRYYQNYENGVAVGTKVKNGYDFAVKANYNFDAEAKTLVVFGDAKFDSYADNLTLNADALSYLDATDGVSQRDIRAALKSKFKSLVKNGVNPGVPTGVLTLVTGSGEGIDEYAVTGVRHSAVYLKTVSGDSAYSESVYQPNVAYLMISKDKNGEFRASYVEGAYAKRYHAVMGAALGDAGETTINGVTYASAQIYENAYVVIDPQTQEAEAHLQYSYDFDTQKATIDKLTKEQLCYVLDYAVYGVIRWTADTVNEINGYYGTNVTKEQIVDAMWEAYNRYVEAGYNPGLPYGEGIMWFGKIVKIGFTGSDDPGAASATTKEVSYLMYNPQLDKAFMVNGAVVSLGSTGFATPTVDQIADLGAPKSDVTVQDDGTVYQIFTTGSVVCVKGKLSFAMFIEGKEWTGGFEKDDKKNAAAASEAQKREEEWLRNPAYVAYLESLKK